MQTRIDTEVLVIGAGGAACRAALEAANAGAEVLMVTKGRYGVTGATAYGIVEVAGLNAADGVQDPGDNPDRHLEDILRSAALMADGRLSRVLVDEAPREIQQLEEWGCHFERDENGQFVEIAGCFASRPRFHVLKGHGKPIIAALKRRLDQHPKFKVMESTAVTNLLIAGGRCVGAFAIDKSGQEAVIRAKAVILAAGGAGQLFERSVYPYDITGDGYALGYRSGADMINMEFMQQGVAVVKPILCFTSAWVWLALPHLTDRAGSEIIPRYAPPSVRPDDVSRMKGTHFPFSVTDIGRYAEVAIKSELLRTDIENPAVLLDLTHVDPARVEHPDFRQMWPATEEFYRSKGIDLRSHRPEVNVVAHAVNGGVYINTDAASTVPYLFAVGEVAGGPHGADRLGGNMLITCQVFGRRAGVAAARAARSSAWPEIPEGVIRQEADRIGAIPAAGDAEPADLRRRLQEVMWQEFLIMRSEEGLERLLREIERLKAARISGATPKDRLRVLELGNMLEVAELMVRPALLRRESRGGHFRVDHPERDDARLGQAIIQRYRTGDHEVTWCPMP